MVLIHILRNLTPGAPWASPYFRFSEENGRWQGIKKVDPGCVVSGIASTLISRRKGEMSEEFLAIYLSNDAWEIFDGERRILLSEASIERESSGWHAWIGVVSWKIRSRSYANDFLYFQPSLRQWFEDGWRLDDIDIAHLIYKCAVDAEVRARLRKALEVAATE